MKQENVIFLVLVLAAAIVFGTTFGIINGYLDMLYKHQHQANTGQAVEQKQNDEEFPDNKTSQNREKQSTVSGQTATLYGGISNHEGPAVMQLTEVEVQEITSMLLQLGYHHPNLAAAIEAYQKDHGMAATGIIDNTTLVSIVRQLALKKVHALAH